MKSYRSDRLGVMLLLLGTVVPAFAMQEQHAGPGKPMEQQHQGGQQARPEQHPEGRQEQRPQGPSREQAGQRQPQERQQPRQEQAQARQGRPQQAQRAERGQPQHGRAGNQQAMFQDHRAHDFRSEHRNWQDRGGYRGARIPEGRFRGHFGEDHPFHMSGYPMAMYGGHPRFQYGGVWLNVLDPFPEYWGDGWYGRDDMYIGFSGGGYYLYNRSYPQDQIALSVNF